MIYRCDHVGDMLLGTTPIIFRAPFKCKPARPIPGYGRLLYVGCRAQQDCEPATFRVPQTDAATGCAISPHMRLSYLIKPSPTCLTLV